MRISSGFCRSNAIALSVVFENTPRIAGPICTVVDQLGEGLWQVVARFGFFEIPDLRRALQQARGLESAVDFDKALFVGTRDLVVHKRKDAVLDELASGAVRVSLPQLGEGGRSVQSGARECDRDCQAN